MKGRLQVVAAGESDERLVKARRQQWTQISPAAQASFAATTVPGAQTQSKENGGREEKGGDEGGGEETEAIKEPTDEFCLVLLWPNFVDHLELGDGQTRHTHQLDGDRDGGGVALPGGGKQGSCTDGRGGAGEVGPLKGFVWTTTEVYP